jgi:predicted DNA-binding ribbon-helix-helix protein
MRQVRNTAMGDAGSEMRSFALADRRTSVRLHAEEWTMLERAAGRQGVSIKALILRADTDRRAAASDIGLTRAIRMNLMKFWHDEVLRLEGGAAPRRGRGLA